MVAAGLPGSVAARPISNVTLMLPAKATIKTVKGQSYSGVRLADVTPSRITYEKGGKRSLPAAQVSSVVFEGPVMLKAKGISPPRGVAPKGCQQVPDEVKVAAAALRIQSDGTSLALLPSQLPNPVRLDLQQTSQVRTLVVDKLFFDPGGKVRVVFKACAAEN